MEIIVLPACAENYKRDFVNFLGVNVGLLLHTLPVCDNEGRAIVWMAGWPYWEVGLSSGAVAMAFLDGCVIETRNLTLLISKVLRQGL